MSQCKVIRNFRQRALKRGYSSVSIKKIKFCRNDEGSLIHFDEPVYYVSLYEPLIFAHLEFVCFQSEFDNMFRGLKCQEERKINIRRWKQVTNAEILKAVFELNR